MISSMAGTQKDQSNPQYTQIKYSREMIMIELRKSILPPRGEISQTYKSAPALGLQRRIRLSAPHTIVLLLCVALQSENSSNITPLLCSVLTHRSQFLA
jgi:hypothetical protein